MVRFCLPDDSLNLTGVINKCINIQSRSISTLCRDEKHKQYTVRCYSIDTYIDLPGVINVYMSQCLFVSQHTQING